MIYNNKGLNNKVDFSFVIVLHFGGKIPSNCIEKQCRQDRKTEISVRVERKERARLFGYFVFCRCQETADLEGKKGLNNFKVQETLQESKKKKSRARKTVRHPTAGDNWKKGYILINFIDSIVTLSQVESNRTQLLVSLLLWIIYCSFVTKLSKRDILFMCH